MFTCLDHKGALADSPVGIGKLPGRSYLPVYDLDAENLALKRVELSVRSHHNGAALLDEFFQPEPAKDGRITEKDNQRLVGILPDLVFSRQRLQAQVM
jgi:hypothetical protein